MTGPVEAAIRAHVSPGSRLPTPTGRAVFVVHELNSTGMVLLLGQKRKGDYHGTVLAVISAAWWVPYVAFPHSGAGVFSSAKDSTNGRPVSRGLRFRSSRLQRPAYSHG